MQSAKICKINLFTASLAWASSADHRFCDPRLFPGRRHTVTLSRPRQRRAAHRKPGGLHCNTVNSCFLARISTADVGPNGVRPGRIPFGPTTARTRFGRRRATGILPVPEHGQDGYGTPPVAAPPPCNAIPQILVFLANILARGVGGGLALPLWSFRPSARAGQAQPLQICLRLRRAGLRADQDISSSASSAGPTRRKSVKPSDAAYASPRSGGASCTGSTSNMPRAGRTNSTPSNVLAVEGGT